MDGVWFLIVATAAGILLGMRLPIGKRTEKVLSASLLVLIFALIAVMGIKIGASKDVFENLPKLGWQSLIFAVAGIAFSIGCTLLLEKWFKSDTSVNPAGSPQAGSVRNGSPQADPSQAGPAQAAVANPGARERESSRDKKKPAFPLSASIVAAMAIGILIGRFPPFNSWGDSLNRPVLYGLCAMVAIVGVDIGRSKETFTRLKSQGFKVLIPPAGTITGSIISGICVGVLLGYGLIWGGAIGAGLGWYTFSGVALAAINENMGALAFLTNLFREVLAIVFIPWIAKRFGAFAAIAPGGGTTMDTTLPIIVRCTGSRYAVASFVNGVICTALIPLLVGFFARFLTS